MRGRRWTVLLFEESTSYGAAWVYYYYSSAWSLGAHFEVDEMIIQSRDMPTARHHLRTRQNLRCDAGLQSASGRRKRAGRAITRSITTTMPSRMRASCPNGPCTRIPRIARVRGSRCPMMLWDGFSATAAGELGVRLLSSPSSSSWRRVPILEVSFRRGHQALDKSTSPLGKSRQGRECATISDMPYCSSLRYGNNIVEFFHRLCTSRTRGSLGPRSCTGEMDVSPLHQSLIRKMALATDVFVAYTYRTSPSRSFVHVVVRHVFLAGRNHTPLTF